METTFELLKRTGLSTLLEKLPELPKGVCEFYPDNPSCKANYIYVYPETLDELRIHAGVPIKTANEAKEYFSVPHEILNAKSDTCDGEVLESVLKSIARELLIFPLIDDSILETNPIYKKAYKYMMDHAKKLPVLVGNILEVKDGEKIVLSNTAQAVFDEIIIHGTGSIEVCGDMQISAKKITHIDN